VPEDLASELYANRIVAIDVPPLELTGVMMFGKEKTCGHYAAITKISGPGGGLSPGMLDQYFVPNIEPGDTPEEIYQRRQLAPGGR